MCSRACPASALLQAASCKQTGSTFPVIYTASLPSQLIPDASMSCFQPTTRLQCSSPLMFLHPAAGDWLQGPYVYHLYEHYGFSVRDIGRLFIMGFGSSAVFGTVAGAMADRRCVDTAAAACRWLGWGNIAMQQSGSQAGRHARVFGWHLVPHLYQKCSAVAYNMTQQAGIE